MTGLPALVLYILLLVCIHLFVDAVKAIDAVNAIEDFSSATKVFKQFIIHIPCN